MSLSTSATLSSLEREWNPPDGFLFKYRSAAFDEEGCNRLVSLLKSVDFGNERLIDRDIVSFSWNIPLFLHAHMKINLERNPEKAAKIKAAIAIIETEIDRMYYFRDNFGRD
jgi:hypothetical protein